MDGSDMSKFKQIKLTFDCKCKTSITLLFHSQVLGSFMWFFFFLLLLSIKTSLNVSFSTNFSPQHPEQLIDHLVCNYPKLCLDALGFFNTLSWKKSWHLKAELHYFLGYAAILMCNSSLYLSVFCLRTQSGPSINISELCYVDKFISIHSSTPSFIKHVLCLPFFKTGLTFCSSCMR